MASSSFESEVQSITANVNAFLKTGSVNDHAVLMEQLVLDGSEVKWSHIENLLDIHDSVFDDKQHVKLFIVNAIKSIIKTNYSIFTVSEKKLLYQRVFASYKKNPKSTELQKLISIIFRYFYDSLSLETSFIEDVKHFCETSVEHLQLGLKLFSSIVEEMQDYTLLNKCHSQPKLESSRGGSNNSSTLNQANRKKELSFRQYLLPAIFEIPFQLLNTKREDLLNDSDSNYAVLMEVLTLLYNCLSYDYFDQAKVQGAFEAVGILSLPCREKRQDSGYLNDLRSQEFTSTLFELLIYMVEKHESVSVICLDIVSQLIRLSVKFFKKEEQKFSQMMFIIDGLSRVINSYPQLSSESRSPTSSNTSEISSPILLSIANCVSKIPIGISFSDGESLQGFWEFITDVHRLTKLSIRRRDTRSFELLLDFWCSYDYFLGHDGAQRQDSLREVVENILQTFIEDSSEMIKSIRTECEYEEIIENYASVLPTFSKLANTWIDSIEEQLMTQVSEVFSQQSELSVIKLGRRSNDRIDKSMQLYFQLHWGLSLLFSAQSYNIKAELSTTNKHFELCSQEEIKEDVEILFQAFESFGKLFVIILNLFKGQTEMSLPGFLHRLMLKIVVFLMDEVLAFQNHIDFDYLSVLIKFTDQLNLVNHFYLNCIFVYFIDNFASKMSLNPKPFLKILNSLAKNINSSDEGLQLGCFPFDMNGFYGSVPLKMHFEGSFDAFPNKLIQNTYMHIFRVIDKHETYKRMSAEADFEKLMQRMTGSMEIVYPPSSPAQGNTSSDEGGMLFSGKMTSSSSGKQNQRTIQDFMNPFLSVISSRIQLDVQIPVKEQKAIFKGVLNQLIGIVKSASLQTFSTIVQFILTNNIFYSVKQVIKQTDDLNIDEINCSLKLLTLLWETQIYLANYLSEVLFKEITDVLILSQQRLLEKKYAAGVKSDKEEWEMLVKPLHYQYRLIFAMLERRSLDFNHVDSQVIISNMFYSLRLLSPEKITHYSMKMNWVFKVIHKLSYANFEIFLLLQPLEFLSVVSLMEESLQSYFDALEPLDFFINVINQVFQGIKVNNTISIMSQHLSQSMEILEKVLSKIVLKISRREDIFQPILHKCILGFYWMMGKEQFLKVVELVIGSTNDVCTQKFVKYCDDIEMIDSFMYLLTSDQAMLASKDIFTRIFN